MAVTERAAPCDYWEHSGQRQLVVALLLPAAAWFLDLQVSYPLVKLACHLHHNWVVWPPAAMSLALVGVSAWIAGRALGRLPSSSAENDGTREARSRLLAIVALGTSAIFALLIAMSLLPRLLLSPCQ